MTGNDEPVSSYVMSFEESRTFLKKLVDMLEFLIPHYIKEAKIVLSSASAARAASTALLPLRMHFTMPLERMDTPSFSSIMTLKRTADTRNKQKQKGGANLSFSSKVKGELSLHFGNGRHCEIAEIAAYVNIYGQIAVFGGNFCLKIQTENDYAVKKCFTLLRNTFNMIADVSVRISGQKRQTKVYTLLVRDAVASYRQPVF